METAKPNTTHTISTPWGELRPQVDIKPLLALIVIYAVAYFIPFGFFNWLRQGDDGLIQWIQFFCYSFAALFSAVVACRGTNMGTGRQRRSWWLLAAFNLFVAAEEISWGERLTGVGLGFIREVNTQGETTLHNMEALQGGLHVSFIITGLIFGYLGWRFWPKLTAFPRRWFSLYFLPVSAFYAYFDLSWIANLDRIRNDQEIFECLLAIGLALHAWWSFKVYVLSDRSVED